MKNLNVKQMESISGSGKNRDCAVYGFLTGVIVVASIATGGAAAGLAGAAGGLMSSWSTCFS